MDNLTVSYSDCASLILFDFKAAGDAASFHYASDDTASPGWSAGASEEAKALRIFDKYPELQPTMREVAKAFLWSLSSVRPE